MLIPCDKPSTAVKGKKRSHKAKARHRNTTTLTGLAESKPFTEVMVPSKLLTGHLLTAPQNRV